MVGLIAVSKLTDERARITVALDGAIVTIDLSDHFRWLLAEALCAASPEVTGVPCDLAGDAFVSGEGAVQVFGDLLESAGSGQDSLPVDVRLVVATGRDHVELHANAPAKSAVMCRPVEFEAPFEIAGRQYQEVVFKRRGESPDLAGEC
jgi:hypothetical protein